MSTEVLRRSQMDRVQAALQEEEAIAVQMNVDSAIVHAHAGHAAFNAASKRKQSHSVGVSSAVQGPNDGPTDAALALAAARGMPLVSSVSVPALHGGFRVPAVRTVTVGLGDGVNVSLPSLPHLVR